MTYILNIRTIQTEKRCRCERGLRRWRYFYAFRARRNGSPPSANAHGPDTVQLRDTNTQGRGGRLPANRRQSQHSPIRWVLFLCQNNMRAINPETFYDSQRWTHIRARALRRDRYQCQMCKRYGRLVEATEVHHIEHLEDNPDRAYDLSNLISLCHRCHNKQHPEKAYAMNHGKEYRKY